MKKLNLQELDLQALERIMNKLGGKPGGKVPRIFNNEAQFQFDLAWEIKKEFDCDVKLEPLSRVYPAMTPKGKPCSKNEYTDIILEKNGLQIALELKYKTAKIVGCTLKNQGAADLGAYDFLWDVHRIQLLTGMEKSDVGEVKCHCDRGYAIILTNDKHYWEDMDETKTTINREFLIGGNPKSVLKKGDHMWYDKEGNRGKLPPAIKNASSRHDFIELSKDYNYEWKQYCDLEKKKGVFKYMIVEIVPEFQ